MTAETLSLENIDQFLNRDNPLTLKELKSLAREHLTLVRDHREDINYRGFRWFRNDDPEVCIFAEDKEDDDMEVYL